MLMLPSGYEQRLLRLHLHPRGATSSRPRLPAKGNGDGEGEGDGDVRRERRHFGVVVVNFPHPARQIIHLDSSTRRAFRSSPAVIHVVVQDLQYTVQIQPRQQVLPVRIYVRT